MTHPPTTPILAEPSVAHADPTGQRTWNVPTPGNYWPETCVTSMGPFVPRIQLSGSAQYTPDEADQLAVALRLAAADARQRFTQVAREGA